MVYNQILKIPSAESNSKDQITYTVAKGDSLWSVSQKFNTTVNDLKYINGL